MISKISKHIALIEQISREIGDLKDLKEEHKITGNQFKGILLEIATYQALEHLSIKPIPLHNSFNEDYVKDYHLGIDLIFYHNNLLFGVECKNLSLKGYLTKEWIKQEIEKRFKNIQDIVSIDKKIIVTSAHKETLLKYLDDDYEIIEVGFQITSLPQLSYAIFRLNNLIPASINRTDTVYTLLPIHGSNDYEKKYKALKYIQNKLLSDWIEDVKVINEVHKEQY